MKLFNFTIISLIYLTSLATLSSSNIINQSTTQDLGNKIDQIQPTPIPINNENKRIPFPDFMSPNALRHFVYDILRTMANGLVDGYNGQVTYFRDYDCFSQAFQLAVKGQFINFFYSLITFEWLFHPINSYNSFIDYYHLWNRELYRCGKDLTKDMYQFFFENNIILSLATVSARFNLLFPLIIYNLARATLNGLFFNIYGFYKPIGQILKYLIGANPLNLW